MLQGVNLLAMTCLRRDRRRHRNETPGREPGDRARGCDFPGHRPCRGPAVHGFQWMRRPVLRTVGVRGQIPSGDYTSTNRKNPRSVLPYACSHFGRSEGG